MHVCLALKKKKYIYDSAVDKSRHPLGEEAIRENHFQPKQTLWICGEWLPDNE